MKIIKFLAAIYCVSTLAGDFSELNSLVSSGWDEAAIQRAEDSARAFEQSEEQIAWRLFRDKFNLSLIGEAVLKYLHTRQNLDWFTQISWDDFERNFGIDSDFQLNVSSDDADWKQLRDRFNLEIMGAAILHTRYRWETENLNWISQRSIDELQRIFGRKAKLNQLNATSEIITDTQISPIAGEAKIVGRRVSGASDTPALEVIKQLEPSSILNELGELQKLIDLEDTAGSADLKNVTIYFGWGEKAKYRSYAVHNINELIIKIRDLFPSVRLLFAKLPENMTRADFCPKTKRYVKYLEVNKDSFDELYAMTQEDPVHCYFTTVSGKKI
ncbi:hypothetical protein A3F66_01770 [candidate division TM6 bacterium RIFCSPHIGHO2_12_FULL_32_22]|nr:MAG: hypothetical protein A3F66_01770 [candidate division TM6 bacterium RIFCSPHIGHO2_12_FULL_32_22]